MGKFILNGIKYAGGGGGGTNVVANPSEQATDDLEKIQIGSIIYDVAGSSGGGGGIDYSITEQDTGIKWIDGRSIYQKTYHLTNQQGGNITIDLGLGENAVDLFIDKKFILLRPDGKIAVNNCNITDWGQDFTQSYVFEVDSTTHNWQLIIQTGYYNASDVYLTIQYVKASS